MHVIPPQFGALTLVSNCLLSAAARGAAEDIRTIMALEAERRPDSAVLQLGASLLEQLQGRWTAGAQCLAASPDVAVYRLQEAFCWLCAGEATTARRLLEQARSLAQRQAGYPVWWLEAWLAWRAGDADTAGRAVAAYLGAAAAPETPDATDLLRPWRQDADKLSGISLTHTFPQLPAALTGLPGLLRHPRYFPQDWAELVENAATAAGATAVGAPLAGGAWLVAASEWFSRHGGLSTFNREFCQALAACGQAVYCVVPQALPEEVEAARQAGVILLPAPATAGMEPEQWLAFPPALPAGVTPQWLVGHDRITGPAALAWQRHWPQARRVLFIHTAPTEIEWWKERSATGDIARRAEQRQETQLELAEGAALAVAVGPRLHREFATALAGKSSPLPCHALLPGLPDPLPGISPATAENRMLAAGPGGRSATERLGPSRQGAGPLYRQQSPGRRG